MPHGAGGRRRATRRRRSSAHQHDSRQRDHPAWVTDEERDAVLARDRDCIAVVLFRRGEVRFDPCLNQWGEPWTPRDGLTMEHVKLQAALGIKAGGTRRTLVAACAGHNWLTYWCSAHRNEIRAYLAELYP